MNKCDWCDTEMYKLCYYGDADFDMEHELEGDNLTCLSMLWNSKSNAFGLYAGGESEATANINFCPKCGRKLG